MIIEATTTDWTRNLVLDMLSTLIDKVENDDETNREVVNIYETWTFRVVCEISPILSAMTCVKTRISLFESKKSHNVFNEVKRLRSILLRI